MCIITHLNCFIIFSAFHLVFGFLVMLLGNLIACNNSLYIILSAGLPYKLAFYSSLSTIAENIRLSYCRNYYCTLSIL